jgi:hypothetical protein
LPFSRNSRKTFAIFASAAAAAARVPVLMCLNYPRFYQHFRSLYFSKGDWVTTTKFRTLHYVKSSNKLTKLNISPPHQPVATYTFYLQHLIFKFSASYCHSFLTLYGG